MHENNILMFQPILVLLHVESQARAKHGFDLQPTANISLFFLPFWGLNYEYFTFLGKIIFVFYKIKIFQNPASVFFRWIEFVNCSEIAELWKNLPQFPKMFQ